MKTRERIPVLLMVAFLLGLPACDTAGLDPQTFVGTWSVTDITDSSGSRWNDVEAEVGGITMDFQNDGDLIMSVDDPNVPDSVSFEFEGAWQVIAFTENVALFDEIEGGATSYIYNASEGGGRLRLSATNAEASEFFDIFFAEAGTTLRFSGVVSLALRRNAAQ